MPFTGKTYKLAFVEGGLSGNDNYDNVPPTAFIYPNSRNLNLHNGGREPRGGTAHVNSSAITATPSCLGLGQYLTSSANIILSAHADGKIWKDQTSTIATGMSMTNKVRIVQGGSSAFITDGVTTPQVWAGSGSTSAISTAATDWSGTNQPGGFYVHARQANRRMVAYNVTGNLNSVYLSATGNFQDFGNTNGLKFTIDTTDAQGIVAVMDYSADLFMFGKNWTYILDDTASSTASWGYFKAPWRGGAAHDRVVIKVENSIYAMTPDGDIYSVQTAALLNDYKRASITRPAFIHKYIANNVDLTKINDFHAVFDPNLRAIKWFVTRTGQSLPDTALVFYLDRVSSPSPSSAGDVSQAWSIHDAQDNPSASGYTATASVTVTKSDGSQAVYTGDNVGFIWELEKTAKSDNSNAYFSGMRTAFLSFEMERNEKRYTNARLIFVTRGNYDVTVKWWVDDVAQTSSTVTLNGVGAAYGSALYGTAVYANRTLSAVSIPLGAIGSRIQFEISTQQAGADYLLTDMLIDFVDRGPDYL